jgi:uncharacterized protein (TIGR02246 family)
MRLRILPVLLAAAASLSGQTSKGGDEASIRDLVKHYVDAREKIDPEAVEKLFTPDADQLVSSGEWRKGRPEVVKGSIASSRGSGGHRTITVESIRFLSSDVALVDGRYELSGLAGNSTRSMWATLLMKKTSQGWKISAIRNMLPATPVPAK